MGVIRHFASPDGTQIACHVAGHGPPVVLVHGTSADHNRWAGVVDRLQGRFTTYAMDRRGRGDSGDTADYAIEREFDDVAAVADGIGDAVSVVGHSYGAVCSLEAALRSPAIGRLALYEPPLPVGIEIYPPGLIERLNKLLADGDRDGVVVAFMLDVVKVPPGELDLLRGLASWQARVAAAHTIPRELGIADGYRPNFKTLGAVRQPTLLMLGGDSPPFLVEPTRRLHEAIDGSQLVVMPGQGHVAMDSAPDLFLEPLVDFLA